MGTTPAAMDWRLHPTDDQADPHGVADLLARVCAEEGASSLKGHRFVYSTRQMLQHSRGIEAAAAAADDLLYVGVQRAGCLDAQADVYAAIRRAGASVVAFGSGDRPDVDVEWVEVPPDRDAVHSQWFLARRGRHPQALVGFLVGRRPGGRRVWEGFVTRDPRLVGALGDHLEDVRADVGASPR